MYDNGECAKSFLPVFDVVGLKNFIRVKDARSELRMYCSKYVREKLPVAPSEVVAEDLDVAHEGDLDDNDSALADLESKLGSTVAGRAKESRESLHCDQRAR